LYEIFCEVLRKERPAVLESAMAVLSKATRKGNREQSSMWDQVKKSTESDALGSGFSFGFEVEGSDEDE
jgi:hypothetical protein